MIEDLSKYITNENALVIKKLTDVFINCKFESIEDLKKEQDKLFKSDDLSERVEYLIKLFDGFRAEDYDYLEYDDILKYKAYRDAIDNTDSLEEKIKSLIYIGALCNRDLHFYVEAYQMVIEGKL